MKEKLNFIENIIKEDLKNKYTKKNLKFRFPPEPNGFLHIGHVKAMELNFSLGKKYKSDVNLRFDDTNPLKENINYVNEIIENLKWLGYKYKKICYASDYFEKLYNWAIHLIKNSKAYVDSQDSERIAEQKGTPYKKGKNSPFRDRSIEENLELFNNMKNGKYKEGEHVLRAKIDMSSPNMLMRDPVMYRILYKEHFRTKNNWCIYPLYDWTHGQSDYIEKISHSLCSLEFRPHRDLYDWFLKQLPDSKYKKPIIDLFQTTKIARKKIQEITQKEGYWDISKEIYLKHGSRRKPLTKRKNYPTKRNLKSMQVHQYELNLDL